MTPWAVDFSYEFLHQLYSAIKDTHALATLSQAPDLVGHQNKTAFIRHDIDVCLRRALELAELEHQWGIKSTYHVMLKTPFYSAEKDRDVIQQIQSFGHEVGLHYDLQERGMMNAPQDALLKDIVLACEELERILQSPIRSLSFHRPLKELFNSPLFIGDRVCGYAAELFKWYLSDSQARWREGNPLESLKSPRSHILQILIHPVWWSAEGEPPKTTLTRLIQRISREQETPYETVNDLMWDHIVYRGFAANEI